MDSLHSFRSRRSAQKENDKLDGHKQSMLSALEHRRQLEEAEARRKEEAARQRQLDMKKVSKDDLTLAVKQTLEACFQACGEIVVLEEDPTNKVQKVVPPEALQSKQASGLLSPAHVVQKALLSRIEAKERLSRPEARSEHWSAHSDKNSIQSAVARDSATYIPDETDTHESCTSKDSEKSELAGRTCVSGENSYAGSWSSESEQETKVDEESDTSTVSVDSSSNRTNSFSQVETKKNLQLSPHLTEGSSVQSKSTVTTLGTSEDQLRITENTSAPSGAESSSQRHGSETQALEKPQLARAQESFEQTLEDYVLLSGTREAVEDATVLEGHTYTEKEGVDNGNTLDDQEGPKVAEPEPCPISQENALLNKVPARRRRYLRGEWFSSRTPVTHLAEKQSARSLRGRNREISSSTVHAEDSKPSLCEESIPKALKQVSSLHNTSSSAECSIIALEPTEPPSTGPSESKESMSRSVHSTESKSGSPLSGKHPADVVLKDGFHPLDTAAEANAVCENLPPKRNDQISLSSGTSADELISPAGFTEDGSTYGLNSADVDPLSCTNSSVEMHSLQSADITRLATASFSTTSSFDSYSIFSDATTSVFVEDDPRRDISLSVIQEEMALLFRGDRR